MDRLQQAMAGHAAEEILRLIYGDDLTGCAVSVDSISSVVLAAIREDAQAKARVMEVYGKTVEAVVLLSSPPSKSQIASPVELQMLLSDRLDTINQLTTKLLELTAVAGGITPTDDLPVEE